MIKRFNLIIFEAFLQNKFIHSIQNCWKIEIHYTNNSPLHHCPPASNNLWGGSCCPWGTPVFRSKFLTVRLNHFGLKMSEPLLNNSNATQKSTGTLHPDLSVFHGEHIWWQRYVILHVNLGPSPPPVLHLRSFEMFPHLCIYNFIYKTFNNNDRSNAQSCFKYSQI